MPENTRSVNLLTFKKSREKVNARFIKTKLFEYLFKFEQKGKNEEYIRYVIGRAFQIKSHFFSLSFYKPAAERKVFFSRTNSAVFIK